MSNIENLTISDVCDFIGGSQPPKTNFSDKLKDGYIRFVQTRDFKTDNFITYIPKHLTTKFFGKKDIMIGRYGPPIFQIFRGMEGAYNVALLKAKPKKNILNDYLYYFLIQKNIFEYVDKLSARTGGQTGVDLVSLYKYPINLPNISVQQKIAKVLSDLDAKIKLNNRIQSELEAMGKTLYDYWFVQFDFPDANGKPYKSTGGKMVWNTELKREIPESWEVKKVKDIAETGSGGTPLKSKKEYFEKGTIPWINSGEVNASFIIASRKFITQKGLDNSSAKLFQRGTILMAMYGATAGQVSLIDLEASTNQAVCGIIPNDKRMIPYLKYGLHQLYDYLINLSSGSARDNLSQDKIKELSFVIPEDNLVEQFYKISNSHFEMILKNLKENQELASLRDWLLPMLMNGQVSVGDVEEKLGMVAEGNVEYKKS